MQLDAVNLIRQDWKRGSIIFLKTDLWSTWILVWSFPCPDLSTV